MEFPGYYLKKGFNSCFRVLTLFSPKNMHKYVTGPSYWPERKRKSFPVRLMHQVVHTLRYGCPDEFIFLYGLDIKDFRNSRDFVEYGEFMRRRDRLNNAGKRESSTVVMRNKILFDMAATNLGVPHPRVAGRIDNGEVQFPQSRDAVPLDKFLKDLRGDYFIKSLSGENGSGVYHVQISDNQFALNGEESSVDDLCNILGKGEFIVQESITDQAEETARLHPSSINTLRLITILNRTTGEIEILPPALRIGVGDSHVDNWSAGGLIVEVDPQTSTLKRYGVFKPCSHKEVSRVDRHPDTGILFEGYKIPGIELAIREAKRFHAAFKDIHSIGWDVVFTKDGISFIEGNDNWEISVPQGVHGGLRADFDRLFGK